MAIYRQIHIHIWSDEWFEGLDPDAKLLYIYLFSNRNTSPSGLYQITTERMAFETGLARERINELLDEFSDADKIMYDFAKHLLWVKKMREYQQSGSPTIVTRIEKDVAAMPECEVRVSYLETYPIDSLSIPYAQSSDRVLNRDRDRDSTETETEAAAEAETEAPKNATTTATFQSILDDHGIIFGSSAQQDIWHDILTVTEDLTLIRLAFEESVRSDGRQPAPKHIRRILERCIAENCKPGEWPKQRNRAPPKRHLTAEDHGWDVTTPMEGWDDG